MATIVGRKTGGVDITVLALAGVSKPFLESALTPVIGDGTMISGVVKTVGSLAVNQFAGRGLVQDSVSIALAVDGIEDLMRGLFGMGGQVVDPFGGAL